MSEPVIWHGTESLRPMLFPIDRIDPDPENANMHPMRSIEAIAASFGAFGQRKPIVVVDSEVRGSVVALAGNGTLEAARQMHWTHLAVSRFDGDAVAARAYAIADNALATRSTWDDTLLKATLAEMAPDRRLQVGWNDEEYDALLNEEDRAAPTEQERRSAPALTVTIHFPNEQSATLWDALLKVLQQGADDPSSPTDTLVAWIAGGSWKASLPA